MQTPQSWDDIRKTMDKTQKLIDEEMVYTEQEIQSILHQRAVLLAQESSESSISFDLTAIVEFSLDKEKYGIPAVYLSEVFKIKNLNALPSVPNFIEGVINVHGKPVCVINLSILFDLSNKEHTEQTRVIILAHDGTTLGIIVDQVYGINQINLKNLQRSLPNIVNTHADYIQGITADQLIILNGPKLLSSNELIINQAV